MTNQKKLFVLSALAFGCNNIISTFIPIYLQEKGFSRSTIGFILSLSFVISIIAMPLWGRASDRSKNKNRVLTFTQSAAAILLTLFIFARYTVNIVVLYVAFSFFHCAGLFLADTIILQITNEKHTNYGHVRIGGTLGYALIGAMSSVIALYQFRWAILLYAVVVVGEVCLLFAIPAAENIRDKNKKKRGYLKLLSDKRVLVLMSFSFLIYILLDFYSSFFGIYLREMTTNKFLIGISFSIAAISEIPFLFMAKKAEEKIGLPYMIAIALFVVSVRFLCYDVFHNIWAALSFQLLQGIGNTVILYSMVRFMFQIVPKEYKASGQALAAVTGQMGLPGVFATLLGGIMSSIFPIRKVFLMGSGVIFAILLIYLLFGIKILKGGHIENSRSREK